MPLYCQSFDSLLTVFSATQIPKTSSKFNQSQTHGVRVFCFQLTVFATADMYGISAIRNTGTSLILEQRLDPISQLQRRVKCKQRGCLHF